MNQFNLTVENPGASELRKFGLITGSIVVVLFGLILPWLFGFAWPKWPWVISGVLCLWALAAPASLFVVYKCWMKFGHVAGWINTRIILGVLFFLVFFPIGAMMRIFASDPMRRKLDHGSKTYRIESAPLEQDHVEKPY
jgi:hypothetical protein